MDATTASVRAAEVVESVMRDKCGSDPRFNQASCPDCLEERIAEAIRAAEVEALEGLAAWCDERDRDAMEWSETEKASAFGACARKARALKEPTP